MIKYRCFLLAAACMLSMWHQLLSPIHLRWLLPPFFYLCRSLDLSICEISMPCRVAETAYFQRLQWVVLHKSLFFIMRSEILEIISVKMLAFWPQLWIIVVPKVLLYVSGDKPTVLKGSRADLPWFYTPMTLVALATCLQVWWVLTHLTKCWKFFFQDCPKNCPHLNSASWSKLHRLFRCFQRYLEVSAVLWLAALSKEHWECGDVGLLCS